ncbi:PREDICTED: uncharacterized protein LOC108747176 isoform X1 [Trachymyrmex septentrionalis]|uniref:uncharacterized protein LOC108747176 isoform X1 n=1 Tax=Trachymyrmex septentrionalis TaxID=34720 RepID=UPI00084F3D36|nr:PREDICTED: uncharacterized protein LOC108747176 isoform X1 [Trachymyrmex septentrionalis]
MEVHARAPDPLTIDGDMASNWQSWKEDFIIFMNLTGYIDKPNEVRANLLKNRIGKVGIDAIQNFSFDNVEDKDNMDILIQKLENYFNPPKKEVVERYNFFTRAKKQNESIEQYINILKEKAKNCNFNDMLDSMIRDKIILETHDKILRKKFFEADNLDLSKLVAIYHDYNINTEKMKQVTKETRADSSVISKPSDNIVKRVCWRCDEQHPHGKCPAWGSKCTKCGDINHFTQCCKGFKFKMNKMNKNLLDPTAQQTKLNSKNNDKWNNQADFEVITKDSINKTIFPDVPTTNLNYINTTNYPTYLPKNTQYSHSYTNLIQPGGTNSDLPNRGANVQPKQTKTPSTSQERYRSNYFVPVNAQIQKKKFQQKKSDDSCVLS